MKQKLLKLEKAIISLPGKVKSFYNLSLEHFRSISIKMKDLGNTNYELGLFHLNKGNLRDAEMRFIFAIKIKKNFALAHYHLARCHIFNNKIDNAIKELEKALNLDPGLELAKYRLNFLNKKIKNPYISPIATKEDYDALAHKYESIMLDDLDYSAPDLLSQAIATLIKKENLDSHNLSCLDIGCGTGLAGGSLRSQVALKSLIGVDISMNMLDLAKILEIDNKLAYNETKELDFHNLELLKDDFDIIISCMSLGYCENIKLVLSNIDKLSHRGTIFGIVLLKSETDDFKINYDYACMEFTEKFLNDVFKNLNWSIETKQNITLFKNGAMGHLFVLMKK